jgi:hypothetical protein
VESHAQTHLYQQQLDAIAKVDGHHVENPIDPTDVAADEV